MRPDERAVDSEVERDKQFRSNVGKGVGTAATIAGGAAAARILPFLNKLIPTDLAMKGLSKVSPKVADFLKRGQSMGLKIEEGMDYIKDTLTPKETEKAEPTKQAKNIIEQYSPELYQFIEQHVKSGRPAEHAAALAQMDTKGNNFRSIINKITKDHQTDWSSIVQSVFGGQGGNKTPNQPQQQQNPQQQQPQQPGQPQQGGQGQQALMAILEKINQRLGQ